MDKDNIKDPAAAALFAGEAWFDPIEAGLRERIRGFLEELIDQELTEALGRGRYERGGAAGHRHGRRERRLVGSFGPVEITVPRARLAAADGATREWRSAVLPRYARMTRQVEALIAGAYLSGTNTRRVKRALGALFRGAVGKDVVSRTWRKLKTDWEAWCRRDLAGEDVVRLILDGTVVRVRLDRKATAIPLLVVLGVRRDGQKVLLAARNMGGEGEAAWRAVLDDLVARGLRAPEFLILDGAAGLEKALAALWPDVPAQRCPDVPAQRCCARSEVYGPQAPESPGPRAGAAARGALGRLHGHDLRRRDAAGGRGPPQGVPAQVAAEVPRGGRQPGGGRRAAVRLHPAAPGAMEIGEDDERGRTAARGCEALLRTSAGSRPRPCCPAPRPRRCCSGPCSPRARSPCARSMAGRASVRRRQAARLTSPPDPLPSPGRRRWQPSPTAFATAPSTLTVSIR
jgi:hypothetical protein